MESCKKERETIWLVPTPLLWDSEEGNITGSSVLPGEQGFKPYITAPQAVGLTQTGWAPLAIYKSTRIIRPVRNQDSAHEEPEHRLADSQSQGRTRTTDWKLSRALASLSRPLQCTHQCSHQCTHQPPWVPPPAPLASVLLLAKVEAASTN